MEDQTSKGNGARKAPKRKGAKRSRAGLKGEEAGPILVERFYPMREIRRKGFEERCLATALLARRKIMAASTIAELGNIDDMRSAIGLLAETLEELVDLVVRVCADVPPK